MRFVFPVLYCLLTSLTANSQTDSISVILERDDVQSFVRLEIPPEQVEPVFFKGIHAGAYSIIKEMIDMGAKISSFNQQGKTALVIAASNQDHEMVKLLLSYGADPNLAEKEGLHGTPLMYACSNNGTKISKMLIEKGAEVNAVDVNNDPAINWATYYGDIQNMRLLIGSGADLSISSKHGASVDVGLRLWHADSVMDVFRSTVFNKRVDSRVIALLKAIKGGDEKRVASLLRKGVPADGVDGLGTPLLQIAAETGNPKIMEMLLTNGGDPNHLNRVGQSPLAFAARFRHLKIVRQLLKAGADPDLTGEKYKLTPLMGAAVGGDEMIGRVLLDAEADLNAVDVVNQCSALHWSMFYENTSFGEMLLTRGADFKTRVLDNRYTGLTLAEAYGNQSLVNIMKVLDSKRQPMIGTWKINEIHYLYADTTYSVDSVYQGRLIITPTRYHIIYNPWIDKREPFEVLAKPTDTEIKHAFQTLVFNTGTYLIADSVFVTTADIAKVPGFEGGKQYYTISMLTGNQMELIMKDETYPNGQKPEWYQKLQILFKLTRED